MVLRLRSSHQRESSELEIAMKDQNLNLIPSLPDDVAVNCLARVPRSQHTTLSLVSKPIRSLLSSPLFFTARSLNHSTQHILYLSLRTRAATVQWFTLHNNHRLIPLPPHPSPAIGSCYAVIGHTIYIIGGSINDIPSRHVWILDCRFHRWLPGPSMRVSREFAAAGVIDGKIYVIGGCVPDNWSKSANWAEVFDPVTNRWESVSSPPEVREKWMHASAVMDGKIYAMADRGGVSLDPHSGTWKSVCSQLDIGWRGRACVVNGILYCYDYMGKIKGFDVKKSIWKELKGLNKSLPRFLCGATMANVGGKLVVVWECQGNLNAKGKEIEIWCAEIAVNNNNKDGELRGEVCWIKNVLSVPKGSSIVHCSSVAL